MARRCGPSIFICYLAMVGSQWWWWVTAHMRGHQPLGGRRISLNGLMQGVSPLAVGSLIEALPLTARRLTGEPPTPALDLDAYLDCTFQRGSPYR